MPQIPIPPNQTRGTFTRTFSSIPTQSALANPNAFGYQAAKIAEDEARRQSAIAQSDLASAGSIARQNAARARAIAVSDAERRGAIAQDTIRDVGNIEFRTAVSEIDQSAEIAASNADAQRSQALLRGVVGAATTIGSAVIQSFKADARLEADKKLSDLEIGLTQQFADSSPTGDGSYRQSYLDAFDEAAKKLQSEAGAFQGDYLEAKLSRMRVAINEGATNSEISAKQQSRIDTVNQLADVADAKVYRNPGTVDNVLAEVRDTIENSALTPSQKTKAVDNLYKRLITTAVEKHLQNGQVRYAAEVLNKPGVVDAIGGTATLRLQDKIQKASADLIDQVGAMRVAGGMSNGTYVIDPEDPKTRKLVDKAWLVTGGNQQIFNQSEDAAKILTSWVGRYGVVPPSALSTLNAMVKNGSPEQQAYAFQLINQLEAARPGVIDNSGNKSDMQKEAAQFRFYTENLGLSQEDAIVRIEERRTPEFKDRADARQTEAKRLTKDLTASDIASAYDSSIWSTPELGGDPRNADVLMNTYQRAFVEHYIDTGDVEMAKSMAIKDLKRTYNQTQVSGSPRSGGNGRIMKYPPEQYYSPINGSHGWIKKQLVSDVRAAVGKDIAAEDIYIEASRATSEAIFAAPPGQVPQPAYSVVYKDENGVFQTIPGKLFKPDENAARATAVDDARAERTQLIERYEDQKSAEEELRRLNQIETQEGAEAALNSMQPKEGVVGDPSYVTGRLETGTTDWTEGIKQIAKDAGGTKSYGNFGLNSGGSLQAFMKEYGQDLGIEGRPGSKEFDKNWKALAESDPAKLHLAEKKWYQDKILGPISNRLERVGVPNNVATDPRVQAYFADRSVQLGTGSIDRSRKHRARIQEAAVEAGADPVKFLELMTEADREALQDDFPTAIKSGVYGPKGHNTRVDRRLSLSLGAGGSPEEEKKQQSLIDLFGFNAATTFN